VFFSSFLITRSLHPSQEIHKDLNKRPWAQ